MTIVLASNVERSGRKTFGSRFAAASRRSLLAMAYHVPHSRIGGDTSSGILAGHHRRIFLDGRWIKQGRWRNFSISAGFRSKVEQAIPD